MSPVLTAHNVDLVEQPPEQGATMTFTDDLDRLSARAKQAEDHVAAAAAQARDQLEQTVHQAQDDAQRGAADLRSKNEQAGKAATAWADGMQRSWSDHVAQARQRMETRKARFAADRAEGDAEDAEDYASFSLDLAYSAIEEAEYAVLDAVLARKDADAAAGTVSA
jgi:hypothetical protein